MSSPDDEPTIRFAPPHDGWPEEDWAALPDTWTVLDADWHVPGWVYGTSRPPVVKDADPPVSPAEARHALLWLGLAVLIAFAAMAAMILALRYWPATYVNGQPVPMPMPADGSMPW
jgi:hypothetical protein